MEINKSKAIAGLDIEKIRPLAIKKFGKDDFESLQQIALMIRIAHCARISFYTFEGKSDYEADLRLFSQLVESNPKHLSPTEHVAVALDEQKRVGNFKGWKQYRKFILGENPDD